MDQGLAFDVLVLVLYVLTAMRVTRLINFDTVLDPVRLRIVRRRGPGSTLVYFIGCPWCVGFWVALALSPVLLTISLPWWVLILAAFGASHLIGILSRLDADDAPEYETVSH